jgi:hypothetical protein
MRKTISIDFDGVIHLATETEAWVAPSHFAGRANPEALRFIHAALEAGWDVVIHSCRFYDLRAVNAVWNWLIVAAEEELGSVSVHWFHRVQYSLAKPRARIYIDDRGFRYEGRFPQLEDIA